MLKELDLSTFFKNKNEIFEYVKMLGCFDMLMYAKSALDAFNNTGDYCYFQEYEYYRDQIESITSIPYSAVVDACINVFHNKAKIIERVKGRINEMLSEVDDVYQTYFITLTFNNSYFKKCKRSKKDLKGFRTDIRLFLHDYASKFVANKDFGERADRTHRLHFHGCILMDKSKVNRFIINYNKKFGFCKLEVVDEKSLCLSRYITKLTYHFLKDSTHRVARENLIYSR